MRLFLPQWHWPQRGCQCYGASSCGSESPSRFAAVDREYRHIRGPTATQLSAIPRLPIWKERNSWNKSRHGAALQQPRRVHTHSRERRQSPLRSVIRSKGRNAGRRSFVLWWRRRHEIFSPALARDRKVAGITGIFVRQSESTASVLTSAASSSCEYSASISSAICVSSRNLDGSGPQRNTSGIGVANI